MPWPRISGLIGIQQLSTPDCLMARLSPPFSVRHIAGKAEPSQWRLSQSGSERVNAAHNAVLRQRCSSPKSCMTERFQLLCGSNLSRLKAMNTEPQPEREVAPVWLRILVMLLRLVFYGALIAITIVLAARRAKPFGASTRPSAI